MTEFFVETYMALYVTTYESWFSKRYFATGWKRKINPFRKILSVSFFSLRIAKIWVIAFQLDSHFLFFTCPTYWEANPKNNGSHAPRPSPFHKIPVSFSIYNELAYINRLFKETFQSAQETLFNQSLKKDRLYVSFHTFFV